MTSDSALLVDETINAPQDTTLFKYNFSRNDLRGTECEEFVFGVTATNAVGESERGITTGGFPIGICQLLLILSHSLLICCSVLITLQLCTSGYC